MSADAVTAAAGLFRFTMAEAAVGHPQLAIHD